MSKPSAEFTIDAGLATKWKFKVFVWPTLKVLRAQRTDYEELAENCAIAFFRPIAFKDARKEGVLGELHFHRGQLTPALVAHEVAHAIVHYGEYVRLDLNTRAGEEQFAEAVEHCLSGILWSFKKFIKRRKMKK